MSPSGSETVLWRETNPRFCAASQHLEHLSNCSIRFQSTLCVCKGIWASELTCLWGRTDCQLIQSRCEETWRCCVERLTHFQNCGSVEVEHLSVLVSLVCFSPHAEVFNLPCCHRNDVVSPRDVMGRIEQRNFVWFCFFFKGVHLTG